MKYTVGLISELLEEHILWGKILGHIIVRARKNDYEALDTYKKHLKVEYRDGEPVIKSDAIDKAEGRSGVK